MLHKQILRPISNYSKAPRGLSVLLQVAGIFTGIVISPDPSLRQCPDRYAIRAGRNLPDKEFRYHRTVIVTAAIHWGLADRLILVQAPEITNRFDLPALGRRQPLYISFRFSRGLCF